MGQQPADGLQAPQQSWKPSWATDVIEILALSSFAIAQPLFDLLKKNPEFFVARRSDPSDIVLLALGLCILPPAVLAFLEGLARLLGRRTQRAAHTVVLACLGGLILLPVLKNWNGILGHGRSITPLLLGLVASILYLRFRTKRLSLTFLSPAAILFPLLFLFQAPISKLVLAKEDQSLVRVPHVGSPAPIIMVVFDELPLTSLLNERMEIDSSCYPHFAALSKIATWYRNATAVSEGTLNAVPSILDGLYPQPGLRLMPIAEDHPHTLFTLLGRSYQFHVEENETRLCPDSLCGSATANASFTRQFRGLVLDLGILYLYKVLPASLATGLPDISQSWKDFAAETEREQRRAMTLDDFEKSRDYVNRPDDFKQYVDSISASSSPTLHYRHSLLPHAPWEYLPSGKKYTLDIEIRGVRGTNDSGLDPNLWSGNPWAMVQAYQRHLLQVQLVDNLVGYLIAHLKSIGLYDPALIVITADHGCSFRTNDSRRRPTPTNYADILAVPLFIKTPYQKEGGIDDRNVETIDILPTIADILKIELPWKVNGQSTLNQSFSPKAKKTFINEGGAKLTFDAALEAKSETVMEKIKLFGAGDQPDHLFRIGTYGQLVGRRLSDLDMAGVAPVRTELDYSQYLNSVDFRSSFLLTHITGRVLPPAKRSSSPLHLAVAINNTIQAVTEAYWTGHEERFSAVTPESAFREGANEVRVFAIADRGGNLKLSELTRNDSSPDYDWGGIISFGEKGNSKSYQAEGWSASELELTWIDGKRASLVLRAPSPEASVSLRASVMGYVVPGKVARQRIRILVNRQLAGEWEISNRDIQEVTLLIPQRLLTGPDVLVITFEIPGAVSPASLGVAPDLRELGLAILSIQLVPQKGPA